MEATARVCIDLPSKPVFQGSDPDSSASSESGKCRPALNPTGRVLSQTGVCCRLGGRTSRLKIAASENRGATAKGYPEAKKPQKERAASSLKAGSATP